MDNSYHQNDSYHNLPSADRYLDNISDPYRDIPHIDDAPPAPPPPEGDRYREYGEDHYSDERYPPRGDDPYQDARPPTNDRYNHRDPDDRQRGTPSPSAGMSVWICMVLTAHF